MRLDDVTEIQFLNEKTGSDRIRLAEDGLLYIKYGETHSQTVLEVNIARVVKMFLLGQYESCVAQLYGGILATQDPQKIVEMANRTRYNLDAIRTQIDLIDNHINLYNSRRA